MRVEIGKEKESIYLDSLLCFFLGNVTHFRLQRHITGKHEGTVGSERSVDFKSTRP